MNKSDIFELIVQQTIHVIPELKNHTFQLEDKFKDIGANSLERTEILDLTLDSLSLQVSRVKIFGAKTIGELVEVLYEHAKE
jgi:polyketide biosynthesis acyl carrier protein